jgi:uncharacterized protein YraI
MLRTRLLGAAAILALSTGLAAAAPAALERSGNVRAGPGTNYPVIATLPAGSVVDVAGCPGSWCQVETEAGEGFVARSLLAFGGGGGPAVAVAPGGYYDDDDYGYGYGYGYGPGVGVFVAPGHRHWRHRHGWRGRDGGNWAGRPDIRDGRGNWQGGRGGSSGSVSIPAKRQPGAAANFGGRSTVGTGNFGGRSTVGVGSGGRGSVGGGPAIGGGGRGSAGGAAIGGGGRGSGGGGGGSAPAKAIPGR